MPEHLHYEDDELFNPETHHEKTDVNVKAVIWFAVIFVVFAVVTHIVLFGLYKQFIKMETKSSNAQPPLTQVQRAADASVPKNQPLLQPFPTKTAKGDDIAPTSNTPVTDLIDMRRREDALHSYGWVDKTNGVVRIPIADAKKLAIQRLAGLGVAAADSAAVPAAPAQTTTAGGVAGATPNPAAPATTTTATTGAHP